MTSAADVRRDGHDPFWDMDGKGVRRTRTRRRIVSSLAFVIALAACGATALAWAAELGLIRAFGLS